MPPAALRCPKKQYPVGYETHEGSLAAQYVLERLGRIVGPDGICLAGCDLGVAVFRMAIPEDMQEFFSLPVIPSKFLTAAGLPLPRWLPPACFSGCRSRPSACTPSRKPAQP